MRQLFCVSPISLIALFALLPVEASQASSGEEELQGSWKVESLFRDGAIAPGNGAYVQILIYDDKIVFNNLLSEARTLTYRTDRRKSPMHLDVFDEEAKKLVRPGIYEINGGTLRIYQGSPRPTTFETKKNDGRTLFVLKRKEK